MNTGLTLADIREELAYIVNPDDDNDPLFKKYANRVSSRFITSGKWVGNVVSVVFDSSLGFITLPRDYLAVLGGQYQNYPVATFTQFAQFMETGLGQLDETLGRLGALHDDGDGHCTQADITADGTLRIKIADADDVGQVVRIFGEDADGYEVYSEGSRGVELTLASPSADTTQVFSKVTGLQAASLAGSWTLWVVVSGAETQLGRYQPGETRPRYRRYKTGTTTEAIRVICQRRFVRMTEETDWVIPGNLEAFALGLKAMMYDDQDEGDKAEEAWARAINLLNQEAKSTRGAAQPTVAIDNWGDGGGLPWGN